MAYILKITYGNSLRRVILKPELANGVVDLSYEQLETKIRNLFAIAPAVGLVLTYKDQDGDVVTIAQDEDLEDALVIQGLNPLKIEVTSLEDKSTEMGKGAAGFNGQSSSSPAIDIPRLAEVLEKTLLPNMDSIRKVASEHLNNLSKKLELDVNGTMKALPELLQALNKEITKTINVPSDGGCKDRGLKTTCREAGHCSEPSLDETIEANQPHPFQNSYERGSYQADGVFHFGVECDLCGLTPIVGPRFKSLKKDDYDLCLTCFNNSKAMESDYIKYDQPARLHGGWLIPGFPRGKMSRCPYFDPSIVGRHSFGGRSGFRGHHHGRHETRGYNHSFWGKLDGRFVRDVTIFDGTELAPGTLFTKIWKLRNSGTLPWPQNTQLVRVGGDELGSVTFTPLELGEGGLLPDEEIEVSVDLVAPEDPGRYISHWRLISPSGVKFGHRIWVSIQVVSKDEQSPQVLESLKADFGSNQQSNSTGMQEENVVLDGGMPREVDHMVEAIMLNSLSENNVQDPSAPLIDMLETEKQQEIQADYVEKLPSESPASEATNLENSELGPFSLIDVPQLPSNETEDIAKANKAPSGASSLEVELLPESWKIDTLQPVPAIAKEETLLNQLETIGFTDRILNMELLKQNNNELQKVLDELFAAEKWDPMMKELEEMGFTDAKLNLRLLFKNNGSLKHVVKELVQIYRESDKKSKA